MGDKVLCEKSDLVTIADAVRDATGITDNFNVPSLVEKTCEVLAESGGSSVIETCTVNVSGIYAYWMYTTVDETGNLSSEKIYTSSGSFLVACNTMLTVGYIDNTFHAGDFTYTNAERVHIGNIYSITFLITASAGEIATISYASTGCCFVGGTQVLTSLTGDTTAIELVHTGDNVVSYNINTKENYLTEVKKVIVNKNTTDIAEVIFDNGTVLKMNAYHPLYCRGGFKSITQYNGYDELVVGDIVKTVDGWTEIVSINRYFSDPIITYNLDVSDIGEDPDINIDDNYYANGIVVKNPPTC